MVNHTLFLVKAVINVPQHVFCYILITEADVDFLFISLHSTVSTMSIEDYFMILKELRLLAKLLLTFR